MISETDSQSYVSSSSRFRIESSPLDNSFVSNRLITRLDLFFSFISTYAISIKSYRSDPLRIENSADYFRLFPPRDGHEEIKDVAAHKGDFDPARLFRRRKSSIYVAVLPRRYLGHFPIMRLEACERGMRNNVSAQRLTAGLKRMLRNQKTTSSLLQRRMNGAGSKSSFFFLLSFSFSRFATIAHAIRSTEFFSFPLPSPRKEWIVHKIMIPLRKLYYSDINWIFLGKEKTRILSVLVFLASLENLCIKG